MLRKTSFEIIKTFVFLAAPAQFSYSNHSWESHVEHTFTCWHPLCPQVALNTQHTLLFFGRQPVKFGIEIINLSYALSILIIVEIKLAIRCADKIVAMTGCFFRSVRSPRAPPHHGLSSRESTLNSFVPSNHSLAICIEEFLHVVSEPCLQFMLILQIVLLNALLAVGTFLPVLHVNLVTTNMHIFAWEEFKDFFPHILAESQHLVFSRTKRSGEQLAPPYLWKTTQTVVVCNSSQTVSRHINLWNNINSSHTCIFHYLTNILLSVETTIFNCAVSQFACFLCIRNQIRIILFLCTIETNRILIVPSAPTTLFGKQRIFLNLYTPTLIVGKMPMEFIYLVESKNIKKFLHLVLAEEMATAVEFHSSPALCWLVDNVGIVQFGQHLAQSGNTVYHTCISAAFYAHTLFVNMQTICALFALAVQSKHNSSLGRFLHLNLCACFLGKHTTKIFGCRAQRSHISAYRCFIVNGECSLMPFSSNRNRNNSLILGKTHCICHEHQAQSNDSVDFCHIE